MAVRVYKFEQGVILMRRFQMMTGFASTIAAKCSALLQRIRKLYKLNQISISSAKLFGSRQQNQHLCYVARRNQLTTHNMFAVSCTYPRMMTHHHRCSRTGIHNRRIPLCFGSLLDGDNCWFRPCIRRHLNSNCCFSIRGVSTWSFGHVTPGRVFNMMPDLISILSLSF